MTETSRKLIDRLCEVTSDMKRSFGALSAEQMNWKPAPDVWSVAQCIEHLINTNEAYFAKIEIAAEDDFRGNAWSRIPFWSGLVGYLIKRAVDPANRKRTRTFEVFEPSSSEVADSILGDFSDCQEELMDHIRKTDHLDRRRVKIASPVSGRVTLSLADAFEILVIHERRHFQQAVGVAELEAFPQAG